jgi:hypothetical protein
MRHAERRRHQGIHVMGKLPEVVEMLSRQSNRFQLVRRTFPAFHDRWHEVH